ncbi:hypothetical protein [Fluviicola sp.]|uniref:hypothetical protein n=1 Tax=Fluviicola sp. TaxID=1917219 RepID=UPI0031CE1BC3
MFLSGFFFYSNSHILALFFRKTFNAESVQFYTNSSPADFETNRYEYPCIIAIDGNQIGFLWFMT